MEAVHELKNVRRFSVSVLSFGLLAQGQVYETIPDQVAEMTAIQQRIAADHGDCKTLKEKQSYIVAILEAALALAKEKK